MTKISIAKKTLRGIKMKKYSTGYIPVYVEDYEKIFHAVQNGMTAQFDIGTKEDQKTVYIFSDGSAVIEQDDSTEKFFDIVAEYITE